MVTAFKDWEGVRNVYTPVTKTFDNPVYIPSKVTFDLAHYPVHACTRARMYGRTHARIRPKVAFDLADYQNAPSVLRFPDNLIFAGLQNITGTSRLSISMHPRHTRVCRHTRALIVPTCRWTRPYIRRHIKVRVPMVVHTLSHMSL